MNSPALPEKAVLGSCEIRAVLGQGGGGISYLAFDRALEREVVIKEHFPMGLCMRPEGSADITPLDDSLYTRALATFCREARILAGLNHPNVVKVHDIFEGSGTAYLVMEYVEGSTLKEWLPRHAGDFPAVRRVLEKLLHTLHYLHGNSVLHRDIKPGNIIIRDDGEPIIIDFGSAHLGTANHTLTPVGSPGYAAPEQFSPKGRVGAWSDLYALAQCFLHHLPAEQKKRYPRRFLKALLRAAAPEAEHRFRTAQQWLDCLASSPRRTTVAVIIAALLAGGILGSAGLHFLHRGKQVSPQQPTVTPGTPPTAPAKNATEPEVIRLSDGTVIYDSSGQTGSSDPAIWAKANEIFSQFQGALFRYQAEAADKNISEQEQQATREKLQRELEEKLRKLRRG